MNRPPLTGADLYDWMALRRVSAGGIARTGDHWFDHGRQIPGYLADALAMLCDSNAVALAELDGSDLQRATLTDTGSARFQQLCRQRQTAQRLPTPGSGHAVAWLADHPRARNVVQSVWDTLAELEQSCQHPGPIAALRRVLTYHQPTRGSMPRLPTLAMAPPSLPLHRMAPDPRRAALHTHPVDPGFRWVAWYREYATSCLNCS